MNTNPAPERTWSLSSKEVKALSHASGSDYVYALTEDEVSVNISPGTCSMSAAVCACTQSNALYHNQICMYEQ